MDEIVYYYKVYGLKIKSSICVPELEILDESDRENIDVNLFYGIVNEEIKEAINHGRDAKYKKQDMWFHIKNLATYHIYDGNTVVVEKEENADDNMIKLYILGSVMGMVLIQKSIVAIHGGGIVIDGKGCIFTGDKGAGKSTITTALRQKGYKFISDDVCSINSKSNTIYPGFPYQKLCEDAMEKFGYDLSEFKPFRGDLDVNKYIVPAFDSFEGEEVSFDSVFELSVGDVEDVEIEEVLGTEKLNRMIKNIFRIEMINYSGGMEPIYFKKCLEIVKSIRYFKIIRPKNKFTIDKQIELVEDLLFDNIALLNA